MPDAGTDPLSSLSHEVIQGGKYDRLVVEGGSGESNHALHNVKVDDLLATPVVSYPHAHAMLSGLWLWVDDLEASHRISQREPSELVPRLSGSISQSTLREAKGTLAFWHAIMHRREGDFSNSKYWYARCADHAVLEQMPNFVGDILNPMPADKSLLRLNAGVWNPNAFVDLVEATHDRPDDGRHKATVMLQKLEWRLLFNHCTRLAAGQ